MIVIVDKADYAKVSGVDLTDFNKTDEATIYRFQGIYVSENDYSFGQLVLVHYNERIAKEHDSYTEAIFEADQLYFRGVKYGNGPTKIPISIGDNSFCIWLDRRSEEFSFISDYCHDENKPQHASCVEKELAGRGFCKMRVRYHGACGNRAYFTRTRWPNEESVPIPGEGITQVPTDFETVCKWVIEGRS